MIKSVSYFNFANALEALTFYETKFGAEIVSKTMGDDDMFKDLPSEYKMPHDVAKRFVMNAEFKILGETFMMSSTRGEQPISNEGTNICFTFDGNNEKELNEATEFFKRAIDAGCNEVMPLGATEWSKLYGMFQDPYGVTWMINAC